MEKVTMKEMIARVAGNTQSTKNDTKIILDNFVLELANVFESGRGFTFNGLGTFSIGEQSAKPERVGVINPSTGEKGTLPATDACKRLKFKPSAVIKQSLKEKL